jgi:transposase InsO family protein
MGIARSTFYDRPAVSFDDTALVERMVAISDSFEAYGYRRMQAALRQQGFVVNHKKLRRLMREHDLQPRRRRRYIATTDGDHDLPIFPNVARDIVPDGPDQLWVADITYVAIPAGFVYVAVILDAWSRKVVGYATRQVDRRAADAGSTAFRHREEETASGLPSSHRQRFAIRGCALSSGARGPRLRRLDGATGQSLRQCQGGELHEDAEGRGCLPDGL